MHFSCSASPVGLLVRRLHSARMRMRLMSWGDAAGYAQIQSSTVPEVQDGEGEVAIVFMDGGERSPGGKEARWRKRGGVCEEREEMSTP